LSRSGTRAYGIQFGGISVRRRLMYMPPRCTPFWPKIR
jgi:hypothetical protein